MSPEDLEISEMGCKDLNPPVPDMPKIAKDMDTLQTTITEPNLEINQVAEPEPFLAAKVMKTQELPQTTKVLPVASQDLATTKTPMASPSSVNKVNPELVTTLNSDLDLMLNKAKSYSESYSKSISEFSESLTPPAFYQLNDETKDKVKSFFRILELPLAEISTNHSSAFMSCVNQLIAKKVLPLPEHIRLEEFRSSLSES